MKRFLQYLPVCAVMLVSLGASAQHFQWHENYVDALTEAKLSGKPILLTFRCVP